MTAMVVGTLLALITLAFVLYPLFREPLGIAGLARPRARGTAMTTAVDALREIEFDHATGKLSESDYGELKSAYTQRAVAAMRMGDKAAIFCAQCGPRPEPDAAYCSDCGRALAA